MAGYPEAKEEICDARCDVCLEFAECGNEHIVIICAGVCKECKRRKECKNRESWPDE